MATTPENHPDSPPASPSDSPEQVSPADDHGRESVEDTPGTGNSTSAMDRP